ncbi:MAG: Rv1355c family protein [Flavobacteriales bacterium]|nr:Rv1355c family protein [Flavobacteriales bacterium]
MDILLEALDTASATDRETYRPEFFRLHDPKDRVRLNDLLKERTGISVHDELHGQLAELVRVLNPSERFTKEELKVAARAHLNGTDPIEYGVWVYYPWSKRLVHLLDETEFARVRTDRNRNKITTEEQATLATKKVGVIGLSVGQSVSLTMALERSFGEIRLADFDTLELSNLNRIRSGVERMGINKAVNTAREIAELDPFLNVTCFTNGITKENIEGFLTAGGKLDLLVEECDSVDVKVIARIRAKALGIPVIMDTSDRGLIDVERFDLDPERPIIHGALNDIDPQLFHGPLTPLQKYEYIMKMVDPTALSDRMKASLPEIGRTVLTWPQLGGHVVLGGALASEVGRKILTKEMDHSGRWYIDLDELFKPHRSTVPSSQTPSGENSSPTI